MIGRCLCTQVQFEICGTLPNLYQCHCSLCRRQSGAASNTATIVSKEQFCWKTGENLIRQWHKNTGMSSHFCGECGSPVPNALSADSSLMWIPVGLIDQLESRVVAHLCCDSKALWDSNIQEGTVCYSGMPFSLKDFVNSLKRDL